MVYGVIVCLLSALAATWLSTLQHVVSPPLMGLFIGILLGNFLPEDSSGTLPERSCIFL